MGPIHPSHVVSPYGLLWLLLLPLASCLDTATHTFQDTAPQTAALLSEFFHSEPFTTAVHACSNMSTNASTPAPPSECVLSKQPREELVELLGQDLASPEYLEELERISHGAHSPQLLWDLDSLELSFYRTWVSAYCGGSQFKHGNQTCFIKPRMWLAPSPIGRSRTQGADNSGGPQITLGMCDAAKAERLAALLLDPELNEGSGSRKSRRQLKSDGTASNASELVISARIATSGLSAVTGKGEGRDEGSWENQVANEIVEETEQSSPGPPWPRSHLLLFYQADLFDSMNISVPDSWDELISLAEALTLLPGFQSSSRAAGPDDVPDWNLDAWPHVEFTPVEPVELRQGLPSETLAGARNSSTPRFALCLDLAPNCKGGALFNAILASLSQSHGTWQGAFIDPITTELLGETEPVLVEEALRLFARLTRSASHQPSSANSCAIVNHLFAAGKCAMTLDWDLAFPFVYNKPVFAHMAPREQHPDAHSMVGNVGVAPLPGSTHVYDRGMAEILQCDGLRCPFSTQHPVSRYAAVGKEATGAGQAGDDQQQQQQQQQNQSTQLDQRALGTWEAAGVQVTTFKKLVNRAPFSADILSDAFFCNPRKDTSGSAILGVNVHALLATEHVVGGIVVPMLNLEALRGKVLESALKAQGRNVTQEAYRLTRRQDVMGLKGLFEVNPALETPVFADEAMRSWWKPNTTSPDPDTATLTQMFLDEADNSRYFDALWKARYLYKNQAPELLATRTLTLAYRHASEEVAVYSVFSSNFSLEAATNGFQKRCKDARWSESSSNETVQAAVWFLTGFNEGMLDKVEKTKTTWDWVAGPAVGFVLIGGCILAVVLVIWNRKKENWLRHLHAPGVSEATTLLHTDIEGSTHMWEVLPEAVCDRALSIHNDIIRSMLNKHAGYECGTEGDAFILAFHTPRDAVLFASEAQLELQLAPWPQELHRLETCQPVYVQLKFAESPPTPLKSHASHASRSYSAEELHTLDESNMPRLQIEGCDRLEATSTSGYVRGSSTPPQSQHGASLQQAAIDRLHTLRANYLQGRWQLPKDRKEGLWGMLQSVMQPQNKVWMPGVGSLNLTLQEQARWSALTSLLGQQETGSEKAKLSGLPALDSAIIEATAVFGMLSPSGTSPPRGHSPPNSPPPIERAQSDFALSPEIRAAVYLDIPAQSEVELSARPATSACLSNKNPTVGQRLQAAMPVVDDQGPGEGRLLVMSGLRVRMGMASGVTHDRDVVFDTAQGRVEYKGKTMETVRAIVNAASGGMILMSSKVLQQLPISQIQGSVLIAAMGEHVVTYDQSEILLLLYQVLPRMLSTRAALMSPVRSLCPMSLSFLSAPTDQAAICYMNVSYLSALQAWDLNATNAALAIWSTIVQRVLVEKGGYLVEKTGGFCLAAFTRPALAIRWALEVLEACLHADWPEELLQTEYGEVHTIARSPLTNRLDNLHPTASISSELSARIARGQQTAAVTERLLFRGLRMKVGVDYGKVLPDIHHATGHVSYRGKVMNRAARISSQAKSGQVLCSESTWKTALFELGRLQGGEKEVTGILLGLHKLKGVQEVINIYQCI